MQKTAQLVLFILSIFATNSFAAKPPAWDLIHDILGCIQQNADDTYAFDHCDQADLIAAEEYLIAVKAVHTAKLQRLESEAAYKKVEQDIRSQLSLELLVADDSFANNQIFRDTDTVNEIDEMFQVSRSLGLLYAASQTLISLQEYALRVEMSSLAPLPAPNHLIIEARLKLRIQGNTP